MTVEMTAQIIQLILAPVVMITSCSLVLSGLLGRYAAVNDRMRAMALERLGLLHRGSGAVEVSEAYRRERLEEIDAQVPDLLRRHQLLRDSVLMDYVAILFFVFCMFAIALAAVSQNSTFAAIVLALFLLGTAGLLASVAIAIVEVRRSQRSVEYELKRVSAINNQEVPGR